ncbi:MAG TPA: RraA family protein, partial [Chloroflexota bacterium]
GLAELETTIISDAMHRFGGMDANIRPVGPEMRMAGPAITVRVAPGDNLMVYEAFAIAQPGDVLVIESRGFTSVAQWGDLTSLAAKGLALAGAVMDGSLRDLQGIREVGFPVFAQPWIVPNGALKDGPGEVNVPVAVGGVPVLPGDVVIGDAHGVVVVPRLDAAVVLTLARAAAASDAKKAQEIRAGALIPDWLERTLQEKGCEIIDGSAAERGDVEREVGNGG